MLKLVRVVYVIIPNENTTLKIYSHETLTHITDYSKPITTSTCIVCALVDCKQPTMTALFEESCSLLTHTR